MYDPRSTQTLNENPLYEQVRQRFTGCLTGGETVYGFPRDDQSKLAAAVFSRVIENVGGTNLALVVEEQSKGKMEKIILQGHKPVELEVSRKGRYTATMKIDGKPVQLEKGEISAPTREAIHALLIKKKD